MSHNATLIIVGFFAFVLLIILARSARIVSQYEKGLVLRLGKYHATASSGLTFLTPLVDELIKVDMREQVINVEPQKVITRDNVTVTVDAVIYYRVVDPVRAVFEVQHFGLAATTLAQTNLRNLIGDKTLDETLIARDMINTNLRAVLDEATNTWGVKVTRVEVQKIDPPVDITEAMSRQMKAERDKRALILESEGVRQSEILRAEGFKQAEILKAEGDTQARLTRATAEAKAIEMISTATEQFFHDRAALSKQLDVLQATLAQNVKYVIPGNSDLVTVLGLDEKTSPALVPVRRESSGRTGGSSAGAGSAQR
ncbi:MAG: SPFH domain-containing protein [Candidatus Eisenbacteria bacterium]|nr:SPFH domain-containing protein [Candidatus Eisenbacteria bacterium]